MIHILVLATIGLLFLGESSAQVTEAGKKEALYLHNKLRSELARGLLRTNGTTKPPAANMLKLSWDNKLAYDAQKYAETMPKGHWSGIVPTNTGEIIHWIWSPGQVDMSTRINGSFGAWSGEFKRYNWKNGEYDPSYGHALQIVWAKASKIGCGAFLYENGHKAVTICRFNQNGAGKDAYEVGKTCSKCPAGTMCEKESGLCAVTSIK